ncbi:DUF305 domain-containing protein [Methylorubrum extorquens]|uniref:DUF305 domain-containing protein n=1 Tax=Methylorubrum extorquens TaxID=408 RepID=A0A1S1PEA4_METEX|nr:DUF305 domain-containing protein [Methylorubrum extorquens]
MKLALAASALALLLSGAVAQAHDTNQTGHAGHSATTATDSPATKAFRDVDAEMHRDMDIRYTNDVDTDFVRGMIPHHKGAIGMAKVALQYSKDPEIRKLAEEIIKAQEVEISQMQEFLKRKNAAK